jgi:hypothetical protein
LQVRDPDRRLLLAYRPVASMPTGFISWCDWAAFFPNTPSCPSLCLSFPPYER